MEEIIVFKGGRANGGKDGAVVVTREDGGSVFIHVSMNEQHLAHTVKFSPDIAVKVGEAMIRMGKSDDQ